MFFLFPWFSSNFLSLCFEIVCETFLYNFVLILNFLSLWILVVLSISSIRGMVLLLTMTESKNPVYVSLQSPSTSFRPTLFCSSLYMRAVWISSVTSLSVNFPWWWKQLYDAFTFIDKNFHSLILYYIPRVVIW